MPVAEVSPLSPTPAPAPAPTAPPLPSGDLAVQVVIYAPDGTIVVEGTGTTQQDGSIEIEISLPQPPPAGTPVQILIYDADGNPTLNEGTIGPVAPDGSYPINVG